MLECFDHSAESLHMTVALLDHRLSMVKVVFAEEVVELMAEVYVALMVVMILTAVVVMMTELYFAAKVIAEFVASAVVAHKKE